MAGKQEFTLAPEVKKIADDLIQDYHQHLTNVRIEYLFLSEVPVNKGKEVWGRARKVTGLNAYLASDKFEDEPQPFFVIEIAREVWNKLNDKARMALVDHELSHCEVDVDTGGLMVVSHDVEEFSPVIVRHGLWRPDVESFVRAGVGAMPQRQQVELFGFIEGATQTG